MLPATPSKPDTELTGIRLFLARSAWLVTSGFLLLCLIWIAPTHPRSMLFDPLIEDSYQLMASIMTYRGYLRYILLLRFLVTVVFYLIAFYIFWRKSADWVALLTSFALVSMPYIVFFGGVIYSMNFPSPWDFWLDIGDGLVTAFGILSIPLLLFVFPDGHIQPRRLAKFVKGLFFILVISVLIPQTDPFAVAGVIAEIIWSILFAIFLILFGLGIIGQVYRYFRVSNPTQRQQTKWIVFSLLVNLVWGLYVASGSFRWLRFTAASIYGLFELHASLVMILLIPISLANSILRYRLYDIDLIIRRSLSYSILSLVLVSVYGGSVFIFQALLGGLIGRESPLVVVTSTLLIAGLFSPLRGWIQVNIDRRFYRNKYDAEKTLEAFSAAVRNETDLDRISTRLVEVVKDTLQPELLEIWLKPGSRAEKRASTFYEPGTFTRRSSIEK